MATGHSAKDHPVTFSEMDVELTKHDMPETQFVIQNSVGGKSSWHMNPRDMESVLKFSENSNHGRSKPMRRFYKEQSEFLEKVVKYARVAEGQEDPLLTDKKFDAPISQSQANMAIRLSFSTNVVLVVLKVMAALLSGSIAVIASTLDSVLDLLAGSVLAITQWWVNKSDDPYSYPEGKSRFEPIGVVIFSSIMAMSSLQILIEGVKRMVQGLTSEPFQVELDWVTILALSFTIGSKFCLMLYCDFVEKRTNNSAVAAYAQDHRNDVMTNILGVCAVMVAAFFPAFWWADPAGAIVIASWIMFSWGQTGSEQISMLAGRSAPQEFLREITHIAYNHSPLITHIDTVRAYHFGTKFLVEVDIVLPEEMPLRQAHDVGESLQLKLEGLDEVERAFVHSDFEWEHSPAGEHPGQRSR